MRTAITDLNLHHLWVVYPGSETYPLDDDITVIPLTRVQDTITRRTTF